LAGKGENMAIKTFTSGSVLTASDTNTYLNNGGLVYITQGALTSSTAALTFNDVFSSTYDNYRIVVDQFRPVNTLQSCNIRLRVSGADIAANYNYSASGLYQDGSSTNNSSGAVAVNQVDILFNSLNVVGLGSCVMDIMAPQKLERTFMTYQTILYNSQYGNRNGYAVHQVEQIATGFSLFAASGNTTTLRCKVYGYRNS
jgi:hypothetical protein